MRVPGGADWGWGEEQSFSIRHAATYLVELVCHFGCNLHNGQATTQLLAITTTHTHIHTHTITAHTHTHTQSHAWHGGAANQRIGALKYKDGVVAVLTLARLGFARQKHAGGMRWEERRRGGATQ